MRERTLKLVVTFPSTTAAMAMEKHCKAGGAPGRLIPVPREITAGCGMAWMARREDRRPWAARQARAGCGFGSSGLG